MSEAVFCVCGWCIHPPCHLYVHEWRMRMLLPSQETLIHLSTKRYTHTFVLKYTSTEAQLQMTYECMVHLIPVTNIHSITAGLLFTTVRLFLIKLIYPPSSSSHPFIHSFVDSVLCCSLCSYAPFSRQPRILESPECQTLVRKLSDSGR